MKIVSFYKHNSFFSKLTNMFFFYSIFQEKTNHLLLDLGVCDLSPEGRLWLGFLRRGRMFSTCAASHAPEVGGGLGEFVKSIILLEVFRRFLLGLSLCKDKTHHCEPYVIFVYPGSHGAAQYTGK